MLIVRFSAHIEDDIKRNWSSWNFGQFGFEGSEEELQDAIDAAIAEGESFEISGFEFWPDNNLRGDEIKRGIFRELYSGYWVVADLTHYDGIGLSCHILESGTLENALEEISENPAKYDGTGEGDFIDCRSAKVLYSQKSNGEYGFHVLEVDD